MTASSDSIERYGRGFAFPFAFDPATGGVAQSAGEQSVEDALAFILNVYPGERIMQPTFGSRLDEIVFSLQLDEQLTLIQTYVRQALRQDSRVAETVDVNIQTDVDNSYRLLVNVSYRLVDASHVSTVTLPFSSI